MFDIGPIIMSVVLGQLLIVVSNLVLYFGDFGLTVSAIIFLIVLRFSLLFINHYYYMDNRLN
jgi:hypothetical protein